MSFVTAFFYDRVMAPTERACLQDWRRALLAEARGTVLEIGAGTGASLPLYPDHIQRLVLSEPDPHMRKRLQGRANDFTGPFACEVRAGTAERIEAGDASFDCVVTSLVCCSVASLPDCLREVHRALKPGGRLLFLEHVAAPAGSSRRRWQNLLTPAWKTVMGNCHLNRETESAIVAAGFDILSIERDSMRKAPPVVRPTIRGVARKPGPETG